MTDQLIMTTAQRDKQYAALENSIDAVTQEITDHKVMWGEEAIPSRVAQRQNLVLKEREHKDAMEMLQSLPMVSAEPVAWLVETEADAGLGILPYTVIAETEHGGGIREMLGAFQVYRTPQAPVLVDSEPVAWMNPNSPYSVITTSQKEHNEFQYSDEFLAGHSQPLFTSPQALTPITADDVTDEMEKKFLETTPFCDGTVKESIAAAYNAVIENRSEAR